MKFQWHSRDNRFRTKPENQHIFFQILVDLISKRRTFSAPVQLADLCSFPCPEVFSGTLKPGSHCAEIQKQVYKAQKPPRRKLLCLSLLRKSCGAPLVAFQQTQLPKLSQSTEGHFFHLTVLLCLEKLWREATCGACLVIGCVSAALQCASYKWLCYGI